MRTDGGAPRAFPVELSARAEGAVEGFGRSAQRGAGSFDPTRCGEEVAASPDEKPKRRRVSTPPLGDVDDLLLGDRLEDREQRALRILQGLRSVPPGDVLRRHEHLAAGLLHPCCTSRRSLSTAASEHPVRRRPLHLLGDLEHTAGVRAVLTLHRGPWGRGTSRPSTEELGVERRRFAVSPVTSSHQHSELGSPSTPTPMYSFASHTLKMAPVGSWMTAMRSSCPLTSIGSACITFPPSFFACSAAALALVTDYVHPQFRRHARLLHLGHHRHQRGDVAAVLLEDRHRSVRDRSASRSRSTRTDSSRIFFAAFWSVVASSTQQNRASAHAASRSSRDCFSTRVQRRPVPNVRGRVDVVSFGTAGSRGRLAGPCGVSRPASAKRHTSVGPGATNGAASKRRDAG